MRPLGPTMHHKCCRWHSVLPSRRDRFETGVMLQFGETMQHIKLFFQIVLLLMVAAGVIGLMYAWFSFIVIGAIAILSVSALTFLSQEIWKDIKRKWKKVK